MKFITNKNRLSPFRTLLLIIASLSFAQTAQAVEYDIEIIIFEHIRDTTVGSSDTLLVPVVRNAVRIPEAPTAASAVQPIGELRLTAEAEKIKASNNHRFLYHGGWRQDALDQETAPYISIAFGRGIDLLAERGDDETIYRRGYITPPADLQQDLRQTRIARLHGAIRVWVGRFLHFETRLSYTPSGADYSFAFESERRMRSRQMHYLDHPRVGIITKIFPVDDTAPN